MTLTEHVPKVLERQFAVLEVIVALVFCCAPLLFNNPCRINIFLSWEGAYRMSMGQMPFQDFSLPMGYGYWVIPAIFFKLFGPYFYTLIASQVFVNLASVLAFRSILKLVNVQPVIIFSSVIVFCFSYRSISGRGTITWLCWRLAAPCRPGTKSREKTN